jgi:hypothetical protein
MVTEIGSAGADLAAISQSDDRRGFIARRVH